MSKYELKERLGAGGHGEVFRAELVGTEGFSRSVAVKRIREALSHDERLTPKFIDEARVAAKLCHPNIVSVFDFYRDEAGRLCLAMELVDGVSLAQLDRAGPLPFGVVVYIITEILRGLGYAHGPPLGLVHRDVTPRNVLVGRSGAVKLSDFGLAKAQAQTGAEISNVKGTRYYISPEHIVLLFKPLAHQTAPGAGQHTGDPGRVSLPRVPAWQASGEDRVTGHVILRGRGTLSGKGGY